MSLFGRFFRVFTFGQSHSSFVGCVIEGFPSNFKICMQTIQKQLNRRRPGQSMVTTSRDQKDKVQCISGLQNNITQGSPLCFLVSNQNFIKNDYQVLKNIPRPGHADYTYLQKYGIKAQSGGGRSSARQTIGRVIAGSIAKQYLSKYGIQFTSYVKQISNISIPQQINNKYITDKINNDQIQKLGDIIQLKDNRYVGYKSNNTYYITTSQNNQIVEQISKQQLKLSQNMIKQSTNIRCPHFISAVNMLKCIKQIKKQRDSLGGVIQGCIYGLPPGLGQPVFDKLPALMAHAMLSIPATKGFQYGSGYKCVQMKGSTHNDKYNQDLTLMTNHSGGALGGISTGQIFQYDIAFKPVSSIRYPQQTHTYNGEKIILETKGRHDPCVLPRAPSIVDNMAAMVIMDLWMMQFGKDGKVDK